VRVKISYTINKFNKAVSGELIDETPIEYTIKTSDAIFKVAKKNVDEFIKYSSTERTSEKVIEGETYGNQR